MEMETAYLYRQYLYSLQMIVALKGSVLILVFVIDGGDSDDVLIFGMLVKMINIWWRIEYASIRIRSGLW